MSGFDIFAWIVLIILITCVVAVFCIAGWLPGHIQKTRGHPWAEAVTVAGWVTLICGFALWPLALIWAYVDVPARRQQERVRNDHCNALCLSGAAVLCWLGFGILKFNLFWKVSPFIVLLLLQYRTIHPDGVGRAAGVGPACAQLGLDRARAWPVR